MSRSAGVGLRPRQLQAKASMQTMRLLWIITSVVFLNASCVPQREPAAEIRPSELPLPEEARPEEAHSSVECQPTTEQAEEWDYLYPKLNSKMARMEQLMIRIERFLGSEDLKETSLGECVEFTHLARKSVGHAHEYLEGKKAEAFVAAFKEVARLGGQLHSLIKTNNTTQAKSVLTELGAIRRENHAKYVY